MAALNRPKFFTAELVKRHWIAPDVIEFQCVRPVDVSFAPGQFMRFFIDDVQRDYTMVSAPETSTLDFCLKIRPNGLFSKTILDAPLGHIFHLSGPHGYFVYRRSLNPSVFVATGTGIAPFVAFSRYGVEKAVLLHGVDSPETLIYQPIVQQAVDLYVPCIAQSVDNPQLDVPNTFDGRVTDYLQRDLAQGAYDFYLCGRGEMIRDATAIIDERFENSKLYIENFD